jgi:hypothetical protein
MEGKKRGLPKKVKSLIIHAVEAEIQKRQQKLTAFSLVFFFYLFKNYFQILKRKQPGFPFATVAMASKI